MTDKPEYVQVLEDGGIISQSVLIVHVNEEAIETFCISDCTNCYTEGLENSETVYVWGEPKGGVVLLHVYCQKECATAAIGQYANRVQKDVLIAFVGHN